MTKKYYYLIHLENINGELVSEFTSKDIVLDTDPISAYNQIIKEREKTDGRDGYKWILNDIKLIQ